MINFFRKIRQKLLAESLTKLKTSKFSKYLIYAIGEIVLVVIGILIALQINNWNEANKNKVFEVKMLKEVTKVLQADKANFEEHISAYTELIETVTYFKSLSQNGNTFNDTMRQTLWKLNIGRYFQFNRGPYDALKSSGIDRISNDSLRNHLINFFDFELPAFQNNLDHITRNYRPNVEQLLSFMDESYTDENNNQIEGHIPQDLLQNQHFISLIGTIEWRATSAKQSIEGFVPQIDAVIERINSVLE